MANSSDQECVRLAGEATIWYVYPSCRCLTGEEYAAAFFLLADSLKDAVNVCLRNLHDFQLAIAVARVYEGDESPILAQIVTDHVLPNALRKGDRWLASWGFWILGDRGKSVQALIVRLIATRLTCHTDASG